MTVPETRSGQSLPNGWRWVRLDQALEVADSGIWGEPDPDNGMSILRSTNFRNDGTFDLSDLAFRAIPAEKRNLKALISGDIVLERSGGGPQQPVGRVCFFEGDNRDHSFGNFCQRLRARSGICDARFLFWHLYLFHMSGQTQLYQKQTTGIHNLEYKRYLSHEIPLPPLPEQRRIAAVLHEQMAAVEKARAAAQVRLEATMALPASFVSESLTTGLKRRYSLDDCLTQIRNGIGADWSKYPVLGATRDGLAPAKEGVGKAPARYKLVDPVTVFYNPMRILLGSIAMVDEGDAPGITSPDYVVVKGRPGMLDTRWFYYWFRSVHGVNLIASLSRGAVRERILFNRLATGVIDLPDYETQKQASDRMKHVQPVVEAVTKELQAINALPAALLRRAFAGEL